MKRILFFSHYDRHGVIDPYVEYLLENLHGYFCEIIIISHSALDKYNQQKLLKYASRVLTTPNKGFDFSAWRDGILDYGYDKLTQFDEVLFVNDSCYGPITGFDALFKHFEQSQCDYWGVTDNGRRDGAGVESYHLQSYFLGFRRKAFLSAGFKECLLQVPKSESLADLIVEKEIGLSRALQQAGLQGEVFVNTSTTPVNAGEPPNPLVFNPMPLLAKGLPLIKRKSFEFARPKIKRELMAFIEKQNPCLAKQIVAHTKRVAVKRSWLSSVLRKSWIKNIFS